MRALATISLLLLATGTPLAAEDLDLGCDGIFGPDASHQKIVDAFGSGNVTFAEVPGDEGTFPEATVVFPTEPAKRLNVVWIDDQTRTRPNWIYVGEDSQWSIGGLRVGMPIAEVETLNGRPFTLGGFNDIDRGVVQDWDGGKLDLRSGPCRVVVSFGYPYFGIPLDINDPLESEGSYSSTDPAYHALGAKIRSLELFFVYE